MPACGGADSGCAGLQHLCAVHGIEGSFGDSGEHGPGPADADKLPKHACSGCRLGSGGAEVVPHLQIQS